MKLKGKRHNSVGVKQHELRLTKIQRNKRKEVHREVISSLNVTGLWMSFVHFMLFKYFTMNYIYKEKTTKNF